MRATVTHLIPLCVLLVSCISAQATPPDIINVRDEFFGVSASKIFVLRITYDNLGLHSTEQRDAVLVALDRETGNQSYWPVYRARYMPDYERDETGASGRIESLALPETVDPFEILGEFDGMPAGTKIIGYEAAADLQFVEDTVLVSYGDGAEFRADMGELSQGVAASLGTLADLIGDYDRVAPVQTRDLLEALTFSPDQCQVTDTRRFDVPLGEAPSLIGRLTCHDNAGQSVSLLVLLPPAS